MINKNKTVCFTTDCWQNKQFSDEELEVLRYNFYISIDDAIRDGFDSFIISVSKKHFAFDLMIAEQIKRRKIVIKPNDPSKINLIVVVAFEGQANRWCTQEQELFYSLLEQCDNVVTLNTHYSNGCYLIRDSWCIENSNRIIAFVEDSHQNYMLNHARKMNVPIINI